MKRSCRICILWDCSGNVEDTGDVYIWICADETTGILCRY